MRVCVRYQSKEVVTQTSCKPGVRLRSCHPRPPGEKMPQRDPSSPGWRLRPSTLPLPSPSAWIWHRSWETPCPGRLCPARDMGTVGTGRGGGTAFPGRGPAAPRGAHPPAGAPDPTALQRLTLQTGAAGLSPVPPAPARWPCWEPTWPASGLLEGGQGPASAYSALSTPPWPPICRTG